MKSCHSQNRKFLLSSIALIVILDATTAVTAEEKGCRLNAHNQPATIDDAIVYSSTVFNVDADGAPNSYRLDGKGLSYTCDGVAAIENGKTIRVGSLDWESKCNSAWKLARETGDYSNVAIFGFATDPAGVPLEQKKGDPLPGNAFISTTSVEISEAPAGTQRRYLDATAIPYVVLPSYMRGRVKDAAVAAVWRPKTNALAFAIFGDTGGHFDEGSVRLQQDLGGHPLVEINHIVRAKARIEDIILVVIFPQQPVRPRVDSEDWLSEIRMAGRSAFEAWGGIARLESCR